MSAPTSRHHTLAKFGIITDIQYADIDDRLDFSGTRTRHYRNSLDLLKNAVKHWSDCQPEVDFVLQLGDIIDGFNTDIDSSESALLTVLAPLVSLTKPIYHLIGNHEHYNFSREVLQKSALSSATQVNKGIVSEKSYYTFLACPSLRVVALDTFDVSIIGTAECSDERAQAERIMERNPNVCKNSPPGTGVERRFVEYNGGLSSVQLDWLEDVLQDADLHRQNVLVMGHIPVLPASCTSSALCWNFEDVLATLHGHTCVCLYLAGHAHDGGSAVDDHGVHHISVAAVIETKPGSDAFATASVYSDRIEIMGQGRVNNYVTKLKYPTLAV